MRRPRGSAGIDSEAASKTRRSAMDALGCKRARDTKDESPAVTGGSKRVDKLHLASALEEEAAEGRAQWWNPSLADKRGAMKYSSLSEVVAAISAWVGDQCNTSSGQEPSPIKEQDH